MIHFTGRDGEVPIHDRSIPVVGGWRTTAQCNTESAACKLGIVVPVVTSRKPRVGAKGMVYLHKKLVAIVGAYIRAYIVVR